MAWMFKVQFTSNEGMSNDAPIHECKSEIDHYTEHYVPYSLRRVCGFFNVPQIYYMCKGLWDGAYGLSSLSEKTRKSNRLQMLLQRQDFPAQQNGACPIELTGRRLFKFLISEQDSAKGSINNDLLNTIFAELAMITRVDLLVGFSTR